MSRIGDSSPPHNVGNVVGFSADQRRALQDKKSNRSAKTKVSTTDQSDAESAGQIVVPKYSSFTEEPEGRELFGFVLDGKTSGERTDDEEDRISELVGMLRKATDGTAGSKVLFMSSDLRSKLEDSNAFVEALTHFDAEEGPVVFLSKDLGFRDTLLSAHLAYADVTVKSARNIGINVSEGDVGKQLSETVGSGNLADLDADQAAPEEIDVDVDGKTVRGIPR